MTQTELEARLRTEGLDPSQWSNGPGDVYPAHEHAYDKVLVVAVGSVRFGLSGPAGRGRTIDLRVGDRLDLPAGTGHDAVVGPRGVVCLEAHTRAGTLGPLPRRRSAADW